jgi:hypothetical protein
VLGGSSKAELRKDGGSTLTSTRMGKKGCLTLILLVIKLTPVGFFENIIGAKPGLINHWGRTQVIFTFINQEAAYSPSTNVSKYRPLL